MSAISAQFDALRISALPASLKPTLNLVAASETSSSNVQSPIASKSPGVLRAPCHPDWQSTGRLVAIEHNQDAASSSQVWQKMQKEMRVRGDSSLPETQTSTVLAQIGHTISICPLLTYRILRKFSRMCDSDTGSNRETTWKISR